MPSERMSLSCSAVSTPSATVESPCLPIISTTERYSAAADSSSTALSSSVLSIFRTLNGRASTESRLANPEPKSSMHSFDPALHSVLIAFSISLP